MNLQWDPDKRATNLAKHGIDFRDCESVLTDPHAVLVEDQSHTEQRFIALGMDDRGRVLVVAYTWRADAVRLISARRASAAERRHYPGP